MIAFCDQRVKYGECYINRNFMFTKCVSQCIAQEGGYRLKEYCLPLTKENVKKFTSSIATNNVTGILIYGKEATQLFNVKVKNVNPIDVGLPPSGFPLSGCNDNEGNAYILHSSGRIYMFLANGTRRVSPIISTPRIGYAITAITQPDVGILVCGGKLFHSNDALPSCSFYSPHLDLWRIYPDLPAAVLLASMVALNGMAHFFGGLAKTSDDFPSYSVSRIH